jgi:alpha-beta hydrolase superfamily lysophospholipase
MIITGHSAGGHLAARMASADIVVPVDRVIPISPLTELGPLMATSMNATLRIDADEAARESPARLAKRPEISVRVWVGASERPAFLWQARTLAEEWDCPWTAEAGRNHLDVIEGLEESSSPLTQALVAGL